MIDPRQLLDLVVMPVLTRLTPNTDVTSAAQLMMGTAAQESNCGSYIAQVHGPALGVWQMEPATHDDIWANFIVRSPLLKKMTADLVSHILADGPTTIPSPLQMTGNLYYACAMARMLYLRQPEHLPQTGDTARQARYYKRYYNTPAGAATEAQYIRNFEALKLWT